jgi:hypothetical protein
MHAFSGLRFVESEGKTLVEEPVQVAESFPIRFRMHSAAFGWAVDLPIRHVTVTAGAGVTCNWYRETLSEANLFTRGTAVGFLAQATAMYPLGRRVSLLGRLGFSSISSGTDPAANRRINLGGIDMVGGLSVRLF